MWELKEGLEMKKNVSGRGDSFKSSDRRMGSDTQESHPSIRACARKNKRGSGGMTKRLGEEEEERRNIRSVE